MDCIVTKGWGGWPGRRGLGHDTTNHSHNTAKGGHDKAGCAQGRAAARARGLAGGLCYDTKFCIVIGARDWLLGVVSRYSLCIMGERSGQRGVSRYKRLYRDRRKAWPLGCVATRPAIRQ